MRLNCDIGAGREDIDALLIGHVDMANVACGGHTGTIDSMNRAILLAKKHHTLIGAHVSYPDRKHFGLRSNPKISGDKLIESIESQITNLQSLCVQQGAFLQYIKAHGALYLDAIHNPNLFSVLTMMAQHYNVPLLFQGHPLNSNHLKWAGTATLLFEAFADRAYQNDGDLVPINDASAEFHSVPKIMEQAALIKTKRRVKAIDGKELTVSASTIFIRSERQNAVHFARLLKKYLKSC